ncbi:MAG: MarC family protein [Thermoplasmatota archaeon]
MEIEASKFRRWVNPMALSDLIALVPVFVGLFAIIDPLAAMPVYMSLTQDWAPKEKKTVALQAVIVGSATLVFFAVAGNYVFRAIGITIPAFRVAGGILVFKYGYDMLHGERPGPDGTRKEIGKIEGEPTRDPLSLAVTPLGIPLLTGPGAIATVMVYVAAAPDPTFLAGVYASIAVVFILSYLVLRGASTFDRVLGTNGLMITTRLMGLILAALAVQFVAEGGVQLWHQLA